MDLPDALLSDFHKSVRTHVAITSDKDPASGLIAVPAATCDYGVCANEACWQITMLDQAGHHHRAEDYLEIFLATQGMSALDGNFASNEGVMQGVDLDDGVPLRSHFGYNLDPGYVMECLADHYRYTGDRAWLERVAPNLVAACEFVIRERERTKEMRAGRRACRAVGPAAGRAPGGQPGVALLVRRQRARLCRAGGHRRGAGRDRASGRGAAGDGGGGLPGGHPPRRAARAGRGAGRATAGWDVRAARADAGGHPRPRVGLVPRGGLWRAAPVRGGRLRPE